MLLFVKEIMITFLKLYHGLFNILTLILQPCNVGCTDDVMIHLPKVYGNAGCMLKRDGLLLAVKTVKSGKWDIPSGKNEGDETADQTAVRETFEETGLQVKALKLLENFDNEFYIYKCQLVDDDCIDIRDRVITPVSASREISEVKFINIDTLNSENTRYPMVLENIKELFRKF